MFLLRKILRTLALIINYICVIWILICSFASFQNPNGEATLWSIWSYSTFFALLVNIFFICFWLFSKRKWRILYSFLGLAITYNTWSPILAWNYFGANKTTSIEAGLKIMSWNVHLFDLGLWTEDETSKAKIIQFIEEEQPDILVLQEYYWDEKRTSQPYTETLQQLGYPYVALGAESKMPKKRMNITAQKDEMIHVGLAIFSKFPIAEEKVYDLNNRYKLLYTQVKIDDDHIIDLATVHLTSTGIRSDDINYIDEIKNTQLSSIEKSASKKIVKSLMISSAERALLVNKVDSIINLFNHPTLLCGDFNDIPSSYTYRTLTKNLRDAFVSKGAGLGRTYDKIFSTLRIDYILYDPQYFKAEGFYIQKIGLSDHYPISANFSLKN